MQCLVIWTFQCLLPVLQNSSHDPRVAAAVQNGNYPQGPLLISISNDVIPHSLETQRAWKSISHPSRKSGFAPLCTRYCAGRPGEFIDEQEMDPRIDQMLNS